MKINKRQTLQKTLKPHWVWGLALGSAIGWGAFVQPINWVETAGPLGVIIGFSIGALLMMLIAVSYGVLIRAYPVSGGEFAYAYASLGRTHAFISGWFLVLGYICIVALNASALALMIKFVFPKIINIFPPLYTVAGWDVYGMEIAIATTALLLFGYLNIKGGGISGRLQFIFAIIMIISVVALTLSVGMQPGAGLSNIQPYFPKNTAPLAAILSIVAIAPWAYVGFDAVPQAAEEFDFPAKKAFSLIIFALIFAAGIYSLMILASTMAMPWESIVAEQPIWGTGLVIENTLGTIGIIILVTALSMGIFTGLNGFTLTTSRLLFAMSRAKILPSIFGKLHPTYKTPYIAIIFTVTISAIAPWFGREALIWIVDMSAIGVSFAYLYTCITAFFVFKWSSKKVGDQDVYITSPWKKTLALVGILASTSFIALLLLPFSPAFLGIESRIALLVWITIGVIFYVYKRKAFNLIPESELTYLILGKEHSRLTKQKKKITNKSTQLER